MKWRDLLLKYKFIAVGDFDLVLLRGIEKGYFDKAKIDQLAPALHQADIVAHVEDDLREIWREFHYSFSSTSEEILDRFSNSSPTTPPTSAWAI